MTLVDAGSVASGSQVPADVCIVGGGPAGITVALALARSSVDVVLLESGGLKEEPELQELAIGTNVGLPYYELHETRFRILGGATNRWAGWCRPMDPEDFESRPWVSSTGWPLSYSELRPHYEVAAELCQLEGAGLFDNPGRELPALYRPPFTGADVEVATWRGSPPTRFGIVYRKRLASAANVTVFTHATAIEVLTDDAGGSTVGLRAVSNAGSEFRVAASTVVLCAGAIESARLLLASRRVHSTGLGNENDLVGRFFMEHPHLVTARLNLLPQELTSRPHVRAIDRGLVGTRARLAMQRPSGAAKVAYVINAERRRHDHLLNFSTHIRTVSTVSREESEAYQAFKLIVNDLRSPSELVSKIAAGAMPAGASAQLKHLVRGLPEVAQVVYQEALKRPAELALYTQSEQIPNPSSRVMLDESDVDSYGLPRVRLSWQLSRLDKESVIGAHHILAERFLETGLGVLIPEPAFEDDGPDWGANLRGGHHHMGTARMAQSARHGVVDRDNRVHSVRGLYVGDSAVFPVAGYANPLLTVVALAWRLGQHLRVNVR